LNQRHVEDREHVVHVVRFGVVHALDGLQPVPGFAHEIAGIINLKQVLAFLGVQIHAVRAEEFECVPFHRIMARGNHHATGGFQIFDHQRRGRRGDDANVHDFAAR